MNNIQPERLTKLLTDMVNIYSPSGKEAQIVSYLSDYLIGHDLPVTLRPVTEGRMNIEVTFDPEPELAFLGHVDTVPVFDIETYEAQCEGDTVHGLGTADMKGGCAAMIEAFVSAHERNSMPPKAALYLVVGEEESGDGTTALLEKNSFPWAIVGEPTSLIPCLQHYGYVEMRIQTNGRRRHAAMAGREYNAIMALLESLAAVTETMEKSYPTSVLNIRSVQSSESGFAVPGSCEAWVDLHCPPQVDIDRFIQHIKVVADSSLENNALTHKEVDFPLIANGYDIQEDGMLPQILKKVIEQQGTTWKHGAFRSHSDANLLKEAGCLPIVIGPGDLARAHTSDECVSLREVMKAAEIYLGILENMDK